MTIPRGPSIWTTGAYGAVEPSMIGGITTSTKRRYDGILSTTREIRSIRWTLGRHSDMKKVLEEEIAGKTNYATSAAITHLRDRTTHGLKKGVQGENLG